MTVQTLVFRLDAAKAEALKACARELGAEVLDERRITLRCRFEAALQAYLQDPSTCVPYHKSMEALDRWIEEDAS